MSKSRNIEIRVCVESNLDLSDDTFYRLQLAIGDVCHREDLPVLSTGVGIEGHPETNTKRKWPWIGWITE